MTESRRNHRIVIVDDHPVVRLGVAEMLSAEPDLEVCGEAEGMPEAIAVAQETNPDLVIVDLSLKTGNGLELIKQLKVNDPTVRVLVSSMHDETLFAGRALRAGAMGYITKEEGPEQMIVAIRKILSGSVYLSPKMTDRMLRSVAIGEGEEAAATCSLDRLSDRELQVFELIGKGMTTRETADRLNLSVKTVETYRENIKVKLMLENNNELICRAAQWVVQEEGSGDPMTDIG